MKTVVPSNQVCHLWANQSQSSARTSNGNVYFDGPTIYSYGSHFPIAHIHKRNGKVLVLFNSDSYSVTTSGHQGACRSAASHLTQVQCPDVYAESHKGNLKWFGEQIQKQSATALRSRSRAEWNWAQLRQFVDSANVYCDYFGLKTRFTVPEESKVKELIIRQRELARTAKQRKEEQQRKHQAELEEKAGQWMDGADININGLDRILLRVKGSHVQTSRGAIVDLDSAKQLLPLVRSGREFHRNGTTIKVGDFQLDRIDTEGNIVIGCHAIERREIERLAQTLGM